MSLVLHAIILKKPYFKTKQDAYDYAVRKFNHEKQKTFARETGDSFRVRVVPKTKFDKTSFVSKVINKKATLVFGLEMK